METERYVEAFVAALKYLALEYAEQVEYQPNFVDVPFEILDTYEKAFVLLPQIIDANKVECKAISNLLRIHNLIGGQLAHPEFDTRDEIELCNSREWNLIRGLAKESLSQMGQQCDKPDRKYI